jgi:beta-glucanase (GH16 family)
MLPFSVTCMNNSSLSHRHTYITVAAIAVLLVLASAGIVYISRTTAKIAPQHSVIQQEETQPFAKEPSWKQDFSTTDALDPSIWNVATPALPVYNNEAQVYTDRPQNVRIANRTLILEARKEAYDDAGYTSGRIDTHGLQSFTYGKIEATMRFPEGAGTWPAFWLLSASETYTKRRLPTAQDWDDPRFYMHDGELDFVEHVGSEPQRVESSVHTFAQSRSEGTDVATATKGFHTYSMLWTPQKISFTVDNKVYHQIKRVSNNSEMWPFDQPMYLIVNLAMGGKMGGEIDSQNRSSWQLLIKDIAYYPYNGTAEVP